MINLRAIFLEEVEELREASLDYYAFQRNAFVQSRELSVDDLEAAEGEDEDDLYYFDEEDEEDWEEEE